MNLARAWSLGPDWHRGDVHFGFNVDYFVKTFPGPMLHTPAKQSLRNQESLQQPPPPQL